MKLGRSQKAVFDYLKEHPNITSQQIGDALYLTTSSCAKYSEDGNPGSMGGKATPEERRCAWASGVLTGMRKKGLVRYHQESGGVWWSVVEDGKT